VVIISAISLLPKKNENETEKIGASSTNQLNRKPKARHGVQEPALKGVFGRLGQKGKKAKIVDIVGGASWKEMRGGGGGERKGRHKRVMIVLGDRN